MQHNAIRHIPRELGLLKHLETIDLSYNQLEDLPIELAQLPLKVRFSVSPSAAAAVPHLLHNTNKCNFLRQILYVTNNRLRYTEMLERMCGYEEHMRVVLCVACAHMVV